MNLKVFITYKRLKVPCLDYFHYISIDEAGSNRVKRSNTLTAIGNLIDLASYSEFDLSRYFFRTKVMSESRESGNVRVKR